MIRPKWLWGNYRAFFWVILFAGLLLNAGPQFSQRQTASLIINEVLAANQAGLADEDGDFSDWIELFNRDDAPLNLAGWSLTDDPHQPQKWTLPNVILGSREYLIVFASGKNRKSTEPEANLHTNFKLNRTGEFLGLYNIFQGQFINTLPLAMTVGEGDAARLKNVSYGRTRDKAGPADDEAGYGFLVRPTPGSPNAPLLWSGLVTPVTFTVEHGFYEAPFSLGLTTPTPGATIRFTTDGSQPTETHGRVYTAPLTIQTTTLLRAAAFKLRFGPASVETQTYIFLNDVLNQPKDPPGFPAVWAEYKGRSVKADYEMDPEVVNDPRYKDTIKAALQTIPTLSIVTDIQHFKDLYANPRMKGPAWERPVSVELIDPSSDQAGFQVNAGLRIQGGSGRFEFMPKHAFRLFFRETYGPAKLDYPLFDGSSVSTFDTLILRSGVNRGYAGLPKSGQFELSTYTRDEWLRASQLALSGSGVRGRFVHLYLNGLYWGLYNLTERPDAAFMSSYFGKQKEDWLAISHEEATSHTSARFRALQNLLEADRLADPDQYNLVRDQLDIGHFIDYVILNWAAGNKDWAFNNWYAGVPQTSGHIRYFAWDGELIWLDGARIDFGRNSYKERPNLIKPLFYALLKNPDFKMELADRLYRHLGKAGALSDENAQARWLAINAAIELAIIGESARWGDARYDAPLTQADWYAARDDVLAQMTDNGEKLMALVREAGFYPELDPPLFSHDGGRTPANFALTMTLPAPNDDSTLAERTIYYTTNGADPRLPVTGAVAPEAIRYSGSIVLTTTTQIKARLRAGQTWSALHEATFALGNQNDRLRITEVMYNPLGGDDYEFIELKNAGYHPLNPSHFSFEGIHFAFPANTRSLAPGEMFVLVRNPVAFAQRYPNVPIGGVYTGRLANDGEQIKLKNGGGYILTSLTYDDDQGWPLSPDGRGDSLILIDPDQDPHHPRNWRASLKPHGSPGQDNFRGLAWVN